MQLKIVIIEDIINEQQAKDWVAYLAGPQNNLSIYEARLRLEPGRYKLIYEKP